MLDIRKDLIRLASENPGPIRQALLPVLKTAAPRDTFEIQVRYWIVERELDSYEEGEIGGKGSGQYQEGHGETFKDIRELIRHFTTHTDAPSRDWYVFPGDDGRIAVQWSGVEDGSDPSPKELEAFKRGDPRVDIYNYVLNVYVRFAKVWEPTDDEIRKLTGLSFG